MAEFTIIHMVIDDAAARFEVDPSAIVVLEWLHVTWPNTGMGVTDAPDSQDPTPGMIVHLLVDGQRATYHTDLSERVAYVADAAQ